MVLKEGLEKEIDLLCEIFYKTQYFLVQETMVSVIEFKDTQVSVVSTSNSIEEKCYYDWNLRQVLRRIRSYVYVVT